MITQFNNICKFRELYPGKSGTGSSVNDPKWDSVKKDLEELKIILETSFGNYKGINFDVQVSAGAGNFPFILHASILPPKQLVSKGIYTVICFDKFGRGAVVGCAESVTHPQGLKTVIRRKRGTALSIDVDGPKPMTKYNNAFENPKEFFAPLKDDTEILSHIRVSLELCLNHLQILDSPNPSIKDIVVDESNGSEFNPADLVDGRKKIARQIIARRGQAKFRNSVLKAYNGVCAVTGSNVESVLEAAHILAYKGEQTNHIQNGILLRSDIHLLFDLGKLTIDANTKEVKIHTQLNGTYYTKYHNRIISLPVNPKDRPHGDALKHHNENEFQK